MEISAIKEKMPSVRIIKAIHIVVDGSEAPLKKLHNYDGIAVECAPNLTQLFHPSTEAFELII
jgi:hypothetical protein